MIENLAHLAQQSAVQLLNKLGPIEFGAEKTLCFSVAYISLIFMKIDTFKNQLEKFQISSAVFGPISVFKSSAIIKRKDSFFVFFIFSFKSLCRRSNNSGEAFVRPECGAYTFIIAAIFCRLDFALTMLIVFASFLFLLILRVSVATLLSLFSYQVSFQIYTWNSFEFEQP